MKTNIFTTQGKATRTEFWITCLKCIVITCILGPAIDHFITLQPLRIAAIVALTIFVIWVLVCVTAKRCHDVGISTWRQFNPFYISRILFKKGE